MTKVMGIDCSSKTIGWSVLDVNGTSITFINAGYIKPPKDGTLFERLSQAKKEFTDIFKKYNPDQLALEDLIQFMSGASGAKTIIMLTQFNRMIGLTAFELLKDNPHLYSVMTIRHGLKFDKVLPKKDEIPELVAKHLKINFPYEYKKRKNKTGVASVMEESYDKADAVAVALYHCLKISNQLKSKTKK